MNSAGPSGPAPAQKPAPVSSEQAQRSLTELSGTPEPSWCAAQTQPWTLWSLDKEPKAVTCDLVSCRPWKWSCLNHW